MSETYNIYCDESCHLENDDKPVMLLGAIWCLNPTALPKLLDEHTAAKWDRELVV